MEYLQTEYSSNSTTLNDNTSSMIKYCNEYLISRNIVQFSLGMRFSVNLLTGQPMQLTG